MFKIVSHDRAYATFFASLIIAGLLMMLMSAALLLYGMVRGLW